MNRDIAQWIDIHWAIAFLRWLNSKIRLGVLRDSFIGRVPTTATPGNVGLAEFTCPAGPTGFYQIIAGPDGNLWFNETGPLPMVAKLAI